MQALRAKDAFSVAGRTVRQSLGLKTVGRHLHCDGARSSAVLQNAYAMHSCPDVLAAPLLTSYRGHGEPLHSSSNDPPPSGASSSQQQPQHQCVSDHEYEVRVGRAYELLRNTLPDFMQRGLVELDEAQHHSKSEEATSAASSTSSTLLDAIAFRILRAGAEEDALRSEGFFDSTKHSGATATTADENQVYHSSIHFRFCPQASASTQNAQDLTEEEAASLAFSGRGLYFASAHVLRLTLNVLFSDAHVTLESIRREKNGRWCGGLQSPPTRDDDGISPSPSLPHNVTPSSRSDNVTVRIGFMGHLRMTGAEHRYTLVFRYDFDPVSGHIIRHTVERIEPAIGRKLWFGLAKVWQRIIGQQNADAHPMPSAVPVHAAPPASLLDRQRRRIANRQS